MVTKENYPILLVEKIFNGRKDLDLQEITEDLCAGLNYGLCLLSEREHKIISSIYFQQKSIATVCRDDKVTTDFVLALEKNALKKLRQDVIAGYILNGIDGFTRIREAKAYRLGFTSGYAAGTENREILYWEQEQISPSIHNLNLPTRAFTCLRHAGVRTIRDCIELKNPLRVRDLGLVSARNIASALKAAGIVGTQWDEYLQEEENENETRKDLD